MRVSARLYATLRRYQPQLGHGESVVMDLPDGATLRDLLTALHVPSEETKQCFVNATGQELDYKLRDGDDVGIFPPLAGG